MPIAKTSGAPRTPRAARPRGAPAQPAGTTLRGAAAQRGHAAERLAERYLRARGVAVVARNFRCRLGELDLVCLDAGVLAVIEVRQRSTRDFGGALASVTAAKQRRIIRAASLFILRFDRWRAHPVRFDVLGVDGHIGAAHEIVWLKAAFYGA